MSIFSCSKKLNGIIKEKNNRFYNDNKEKGHF